MPRPGADLVAERAWALRHSDAESSVALAEGRRHEALQCGDALGAARADLSLAWSRFRAGDLPAMLTLAGQAVAVLGGHRDAWLARGYLVMANATAGIHERETANELFGRAMEIAWALEDLELVATAMHDNACQVEDPVAAVDALRRAEQLFREAGHAEAQCFAAFNIAERLLEGGDMTAAVRAANRAAHIARLTGLSDLELMSRLAEARANAALGQTARARALTHRVLDRARHATSDARPFHEADAAGLLVAIDEPRLATLVAADLLEHGAPDSLVPQLHQILAEAASALGEPDVAYAQLTLVLDEEARAEHERERALAAARASLRAAQKAEAEAEDARRRARDLAEHISRLPGGPAAARELSRTDAVTGLRTRPYLIAEIDRMAREPSPPLPITVALVDIDGLAEVNRTFGRETGDDVLALVAHVLRVTVRSSDLVCRFGDDEIALLVPDLGAEHAIGYAERLLAAARDTCEETGITVALSAGVATTTTRPGIHGLLTRADLALYHVKSEGGDHVRAAPPRPEEAGSPGSPGLDLAQ